MGKKSIASTLQFLTSRPLLASLGFPTKHMMLLKHITLTALELSAVLLNFNKRNTSLVSAQHLQLSDALKVCTSCGAPLRTLAEW